MPTERQTSPRVVVWEPNPSTRADILRALTASGCCAHAPATSSHVDLTACDLLVLDWEELPVRERLLANRPIALPLIALVEDADAVAGALAEGATDCLVRPARPEEVVARVRVVSHLRAARAESVTRDPLTGLLDQTAFTSQLMREVALARRRGTALALVLIDLDDRARDPRPWNRRLTEGLLAEVADCVREGARDADPIARVGDEEIAWLLPAADGVAAQRAAERVRRAIASRSRPGGGVATISCGVAELGPGETALDARRQAEVAVQWAKVSGGDRVVRYSFAVAEELFASQAAAPAEAANLRAIRALAWAVDAKDPHTHRHSMRVADLSVRLASSLGWPVGRCARLREAALLHDVGKIAIPDAVLFKASPLDAQERRKIAEHPVVGARIVADVLTPEQAGWVRSHHERWDGSGYPDRLAAEQIPEEARVLAIADAWDAMTSARIYRDPLTPGEALDELRGNAGTQFWAVAVEALGRLIAAGAVRPGLDTTVPAELPGERGAAQAVPASAEIGTAS